MTLPVSCPDQYLKLWEPHLNGFVELCKADSHGDGPLAGLRVGVKDVIDVAGVATRNGSATCENIPPAREDAPVIATLRTAGARIIGKTVTTEFAFTDPTDCRNPHDLRRSPGGSSSGSGATVAARVVDVALGTQTAGSLCRPAAYCGVVGFKPTYGLLPTAGVTPLARSFDTVGIIAGSVALAHKTFSVLVSPDDAHSETPPRKIISGVWQTDASPDDDTRAAFEAATGALAVLGADVRQAPMTAAVGPIVTAHRLIMQYEAFGARGAMLNDTRNALLKPRFLAGLRAGANISSDEVTQAKDFLSEAKQAFWAGLEGVDMILTLLVPEGAPLIDGTTGFQDWLTPWTVFGGPLVCLPWGTDRLRRPLSVMLAARPGQDHQLLAKAARLERASPPIPAPQLPQA